MQLGAALVLGGMLIAAGVPKTAVPWYVASALRRVTTAGSDGALLVVGRLLGCWEVTLGLALLLVDRGPAAVAVAAGAVLTFAAFTGFVAAAIRRGAGCGCWASLSEGPAGGAELARAAFLAALALALLAARLQTSPLRSAPGWATPASAAALLVALWLATRLGAAALPVGTAALRRRLQAQSAPGRAGRLAGQLALLAGFVNAGTSAGRRRYRAARLTAGPSAPVRPTSLRRSTTALPPRPAVLAPAVPAAVTPPTGTPRGAAALALAAPAVASAAATAGCGR